MPNQGTFRFMKPQQKKTPPQRRPTVAAARREVMAGLEDGVTCPCCDQLCKLYKRKFNSGMARIMIWMVQTYDGSTWINVPETAPVYVRRSNEVSRLCIWGLALEHPNDDPMRRNSGLYKPTQKGYDFARRRISIPSHVHIYNNKVMGWSDRQVDIEAALGAKFSYGELMNG